MITSPLLDRTCEVSRVKMTPSASPKSSFSFTTCAMMPWLCTAVKKMFNGLVWGFLSTGISAGWWFQPLLKNISHLIHLGWWNSQCMEKSNSCSKPPTRVVFFRFAHIQHHEFLGNGLNEGFSNEHSATSDLFQSTGCPMYFLNTASMPSLVEIPEMPSSRSWSRIFSDPWHLGVERYSTGIPEFSHR